MFESAFGLLDYFVKLYELDPFIAEYLWWGIVWVFISKFMLAMVLMDDDRQREYFEHRRTLDHDIINIPTTIIFWPASAFLVAASIIVGVFKGLMWSTH